MRLPIALSIYVCLAIGCVPVCSAAEWVDTHNAGQTAVQRHDYETAVSLFRKSWDISRANDQRAYAANDLGVTLNLIGRNAEAKEWLERALTSWPRVPERTARIARTAESLAIVDRALGDYRGAESALRTALALPLNDADCQTVLLNELADILREQGHATAARELFEKADALSPSWQRKFDTTIGIASLEREAGLWRQSMSRWEKAAQLARTNNSSDLEAIAWRGSADVLIDQGSHARAEPLLHRALSVFQNGDPSSAHVGATLASLARVYLAEDKIGLAQEALERAVGIDEKRFGPNHPQVAVLLEMLGDTAGRANHLDSARSFYERAQGIMALNFGEASPAAAAVEASWATVAQRAKRTDEAAQHYRNSLAVLDKAGPEVQQLRVTVMEHYAETLNATHRKREASALREQIKSLLSADYSYGAVASSTFVPAK